MTDSALSIDSGIAHLRPYAVTGGRTVPTHPLDRISLVKVRSSAHVPPNGLVQEAVFQLCRTQALSIAELSARLGQAVQAVKIVVADLLDQSVLIQAMPQQIADASDPATLEKLLAGLRQL
ncbi:DUF742 domain-containing protein [Streptomyces sp. NPDC001037]|uniref:DUF742 domain-containing protein n=1 Tax=Streptomyces sp. NPDC001037 TaxID=3364542 RepID=UPI0036C6F03E